MTRGLYTAKSRHKNWSADRIGDPPQNKPATTARAISLPHLLSRAVRGVECPCGGERRTRRWVERSQPFEPFQSMLIGVHQGLVKRPGIVPEASPVLPRPGLGSCRIPAVGVSDAAPRIQIPN
jgi:hypothetical protein